MKLFKNVLALAVLLAFVAAGSFKVQAYQRAPGGQSTSITTDNGNTIVPFNVAIGTTTPVKVYSKTSGRVDRKFRICNDQDSTYRLLLSTTSAFNGSATQSSYTFDSVAANDCNELLTPTQDWYAVFRSSSATGTFTGGRAYGFKQYDSKD
jgi:hypothetical protein